MCPTSSTHWWVFQNKQDQMLDIKLRQLKKRTKKRSKDFGFHSVESQESEGIDTFRFVIMYLKVILAGVGIYWGRGEETASCPSDVTGTWCLSTAAAAVWEEDHGKEGLGVGTGRDGGGQPGRSHALHIRMLGKVMASVAWLDEEGEGKSRMVLAWESGASSASSWTFLLDPRSHKAKLLPTPTFGHNA